MVAGEQKFAIKLKGLTLHPSLFGTKTSFLSRLHYMLDAKSVVHLFLKE